MKTNKLDTNTASSQNQKPQDKGQTKMTNTTNSMNNEYTIYRTNANSDEINELARSSDANKMQKALKQLKLNELDVLLLYSGKKLIGYRACKVLVENNLESFKQWIRANAVLLLTENNTDSASN